MEKPAIVRARVVLIAVVLTSAAAVEAEVCTSPCEVRGSSPQLKFEDTDTGAPLWGIYSQSNGAQLQFGTAGSGVLNLSQLVLHDSRQVSMNLRGVYPQSFNDVQIGDADLNGETALALSVSGSLSGRSGRISVGPAGFNVTVRSIEADDYDNVIALSMSADDNAFAIDGSSDVAVGGVSIPNIIDDFHVRGGQVFLDPSGTAGDWQLSPGSAGFWLMNEDGTPTTPFKITNDAATDMLVVDTAGIGIGTALPSEDVDIRGSSPTIALTDVAGTHVNRIWEINSNSGSGIFDIRDVTAGSSPLKILANSLDDALVIDSSGVTMSSSRSLKRNIEPVVPSELLDELAELPIYSWSYASDESGSLHVGPMAEDFYRRFGLGASEKRLSSIDTSGVALAAIQALHQELEKRDAEIAELREAVELLLAERGE